MQGDIASQLHSVKGVQFARELIDRLRTEDGIVVVEFPDSRKYVLTVAGSDEVYIEAYDGGIEGKVVSVEVAASFLHTSANAGETQAAIDFRRIATVGTAN